MDDFKRDMPALLIIDMVKDYFDEDAQLPITPLASGIVDPINRAIDAFRKRRWPVVFSTDSFKSTDFIFSGRLKPHSLAGTNGAEVIEALDRQPDDLWLPKPRFSAFWGTDLDRHLRRQQVTLCAVAGIATHICVLTTVLDALCHDFKAVLLEDCTTAYPLKKHQQILTTYRRNPLYPLLQIMPWDELISKAP